jgi:hypothetical protein
MEALIAIAFQWNDTELLEYVSIFALETKGHGL